MWESMPNYIGDTFRESKITLEIFFFSIFKPMWFGNVVKAKAITLLEVVKRKCT